MHKKACINAGAFFSAYSFGEGVITPEKLAVKLKELNHPFLPITDSAGFWNLVPAIKAATKFDLKIIPGAFFPLNDGGFFLYSGDEESYRSICRIISCLHFSRKQTDGALFNTEDLRLLGGTGRAVAIGKEALENIPKIPPSWKSFWGIPEMFPMAEAKKIAPVARQFRVTPAAFPVLRYTDKTDQTTLKIVKAIHENELASRIEIPESGMLREPDVMASVYSWFPECIEGNKRFFEFHFWAPPTGIYHTPEMSANSELSRIKLWKLAENGARKRYGTITPQILNRLKYEFNIIIEKNFTDYFLLVHEITEEAERLGHRVLGRGSAANSIISYCLRFTHVDPLKYGLFFERFLNPQRSSPPDIDLDFSWRIRDEIYSFLQKRWGNDKVALISAHITLGGRGAIRETGKTLGFTEIEISKLTKAVGHKSICDLNNIDNFSPSERKLLKTASLVEGLPVHLSLHAGGVVISPSGIDHFTPIQPSSKPIPMTQMDMYSLEEIGLVKIDLLSQRALGVYCDLMNHLRINKVLNPILEDVEAITNDPLVSEALMNGDTIGVFYIESPGMRSLLKKLKCRTFSELTAASSIIRPGVAESGMMQTYIKRHRDRSEVPLIHPLLEDILSETYGVMIYQEDVIKCSCAIAGFSLGDADLLRRAMSGKHRGDTEMDKIRERFLEGAFNRGVDENTALEIWRQIESFSGYAFCKAHSASYAILSLQLLWMKRHFPAHFAAAVINNRGGFYNPQVYIDDAVRSGIKFEAPDINKSDFDCTVAENTVTIGLSFVQSLSEISISNILSERKHSPFLGVPDFAERVSLRENEWENLIKSGAFRTFANPAECRWLRKYVEPPFSSRKPLTSVETAKLELESTGMATSINLLDLYTCPAGVIRATEMGKFTGKKVKMAGIIISSKTVYTKKNQKMKFLSFEDKTGTFEVILFPQACKSFSQISFDVGAFMIEGIVSSEYDSHSLNASLIRALPQVNTKNYSF
ncbi:MAG: DNA polymerase III subunit alpha [Candidatus Riflebacteria bacterium]|nr:DNA polymerase III subunit alpha [Candidatus Riflebacteria bacterium]